MLKEDISFKKYKQTTIFRRNVIPTNTKSYDCAQNRHLLYLPNME